MNLKTIIGCVLLSGLVSTCIDKLPDAMNYETNQQRVMASKTYQHLPGLYEYNQVAQNNQ